MGDHGCGTKEVPDPLLLECHEAVIQRWTSVSAAGRTGLSQEAKLRQHESCNQESQNTSLFQLWTPSSRFNTCHLTIPESGVDFKNID